MNVPVAGPSHSLTALASWVARVASAVAAGWNVEHRTDGRHRFPWVSPSSVTATGWTITSFSLLKYQVVDKTMTLQFVLAGTATAVVELRMSIPSGYVAVSAPCAGTFAYFDGASGTGLALASGANLLLYKDMGGTAWPAGAVSLQGTLIFEVQ